MSLPLLIGQFRINILSARPLHTAAALYLIIDFVLLCGRLPRCLKRKFYQCTFVVFCPTVRQTGRDITLQLCTKTLFPVEINRLNIINKLIVTQFRRRTLRVYKCYNQHMQLQLWGNKEQKRGLLVSVFFSLNAKEGRVWDKWTRILSKKWLSCSRILIFSRLCSERWTLVYAHKILNTIWS